jgi:hypothetical protein
VQAPQDDSTGCIVCTIGTSIIEGLAKAHDKTVGTFCANHSLTLPDKVLEDICDLFPAEVQATCIYYVDLYGDEIVRLFMAGYNVRC